MQEILLAKLKNRLSITWQDDIVDENLRNIIESAIPTMNHKLGAEIDYSAPGQEQTLFLKYCMYDYNECSNEFDSNYISEIYQCRNKIEVKRRREKNRNL